jgi:hypothetical protein
VHNDDQEMENSVGVEMFMNRSKEGFHILKFDTHGRGLIDVDESIEQNSLGDTFGKRKNK